MRPEQKLYDAMTVGSPATAIVATVGENVWATLQPQTEGLPAVIFQRTSTVYYTTIHSNVAITQTATFDVFCLAAEYGDAEALGDLVEALDVDGIRVIDRSSTVGESEDSPYASIITVEVDVT